MAIDKSVLKKELEMQIKTWQNITNPFAAQLFGSNVKSMLENEELMSLYSRTDTEQIIEEYGDKIEEIRKLVTSPENTKKRNILNVLEYIRHMHSFENIKENGIIEFVSSLSQSSVSQVFLGKGVCASQAKLMRDILPQEAKQITVNFMDEEETNMILESHDVVITEIDDKLYYIDPTWYNGSKKSIEGSKNSAKYGNYTFESFDASEEEIKASREEIQERLIQLLHIDEISKQIIKPGMTDLQKHCAIFTYIEQRINRQDGEVSFATAKIAGQNMDTGKLMELFFAANGIEYDMQQTGERSNTIYSVLVNEEQEKLYPPIMFDSKREDGKHLTQSLHYVKGEDGKTEYLSRRSPEILQEYKEAIYSGRERAKALETVKSKDEAQIE